MARPPRLEFAGALYHLAAGATRAKPFLTATPIASAFSSNSIRN